MILEEPASSMNIWERMLKCEYLRRECGDQRSWTSIDERVLELEVLKCERYCD